MSRIGGRGPGSRIQHDKTIDAYKDKGKQAEQIETIPSAVAVSEVTLQPPTIAGVSYLNSLPEELLCEIFIYTLSEANGLSNQWTAAALRLTCKRFNTLITAPQIQRRLLLPIDDKQLRFRLLKTTPEDKVVTFLPYCWTVGSQNYALAVPATGTMNKFFIGIVTIDIDGRIEFIDETEPHFENGVFPPLRPKYDHVDGRVAATLAEKNGYIYVATRPVPRYEAGPVELWRFDLGDRQWTLIDTWELDILWGASMSILFDETVLMLVGGMSMVATNVQCYLYLLSSRVGYGVVTNVTGKPPPVLAHKAYPIQPTPDQDPLTERILVLGTATGHQHHDGNLHYHLELTWGWGASSSSGSRLGSRRHTRRPGGGGSFFSPSPSPSPSSSSSSSSSSAIHSNRKSQMLQTETNFRVTWSKLRTKFAPPQRGRAQCAGLVPDGQVALVHSYCVLGQREPPSLIALNLRTWIWSEVNLALHHVERHPMHAFAGGPGPGAGGAGAGALVAASAGGASGSGSSIGNGSNNVMWSCLPCQGLLVLNDGTEWRVALLNSDFGRASLSFLRSERIPKPSITSTPSSSSSSSSSSPSSAMTTQQLSKEGLEGTQPIHTSFSEPNLHLSPSHRNKKCSIQ